MASCSGGKDYFSGRPGGEIIAKLDVSNNIKSVSSLDGEFPMALFMSEDSLKLMIYNEKLEPARSFSTAIADNEYYLHMWVNDKGVAVITWDKEDWRSTVKGRLIDLKSMKIIKEEVLFNYVRLWEGEYTPKTIPYPVSAENNKYLGLVYFANTETDISEALIHIFDENLNKTRIFEKKVYQNSDYDDIMVAALDNKGSVNFVSVVHRRGKISFTAEKFSNAPKREVDTDFVYDTSRGMIYLDSRCAYTLDNDNDIIYSAAYGRDIEKNKNLVLINTFDMKNQEAGPILSIDFPGDDLSGEISNPHNYVIGDMKYSEGIFAVSLEERQYTGKDENEMYNSGKSIVFFIDKNGKLVSQSSIIPGELRVDPDSVFVYTMDAYRKSSIPALNTEFIDSGNDLKLFSFKRATNSSLLFANADMKAGKFIQYSKMIELPAGSFIYTSTITPLASGNYFFAGSGKQNSKGRVFLMTASTGIRK